MKKIALTGLIVAFLLTGCTTESHPDATTGTIIESYMENEIVSYTDETVGLDIYFNNTENIELDGNGKIEEGSFIPDGEGISYLTSGKDKLTIEVKDSSTRLKDKFYYTGDISEENGQKIFTTNDGNKYTADFYIELDTNDNFDFNTVLSNITNVDFIVGTPEIYEKVSSDNYKFHDRGDNVFIVKNVTDEKLVLIHVECKDCKN